MSRSLVRLALFALVLASPAALAFNVYTVGGDAACGFAFIQDAIDAAKNNPGEDYVFIASNRTYGDQHLVVSDDTVDIVGGFPDCTQLGDPGLLQTTIGGTNGHSVFEIEGTSHVYLSNFVITGAVMDDSHSGGGIYFGGEGSLFVRYSWIFANQAGYGGGIDVSPSGHTDFTLTGSTVSLNTALVSGGGIRIEGDTTMTATATATDNIYITTNFAQGNGATGYGGGVEVLGPATANLSANINSNTANNGAGIAAIGTDSGPALVNFYTTNAATPATLYGNVASNSGGGVYVRPEGVNFGKLCAADFAIDSNQAIFGSAVMVAADNFSNGAIAFLNQEVCDLPSDAVRCAPGAGCNEINGNVASGDSASATLYVAGTGALAASRVAMRSNQADAIVYFDAETAESSGGDYAHLHDCLIADNTIGGNLIRAFGGAARTSIIVDTCTIANNAMGDNFYVIGADTNFLEVTNSIVYQPNQPSAIFFGPAGDLTASYILTNDTIPFTGLAGILDGAPVFVDAASGNYHLQRTSPGVDFAPAIDGVDFDGNPRSVDLADIPNGDGWLDVGAFEIQDQLPPLGCSTSDTIFCYGFDGL